MNGPKDDDAIAGLPDVSRRHPRTTVHAVFADPPDSLDDLHFFPDGQYRDGEFTGSVEAEHLLEAMGELGRYGLTSLTAAPDPPEDLRPGPLGPGGGNA